MIDDARLQEILAEEFEKVPGDYGIVAKRQAVAIRRGQTPSYEIACALIAMARVRQECI